MSNFDVVRSSLGRYFDTIRARVHDLLEPLSTAELWTRPHEYGNSIGNLVLHLNGNLNYYIGSRIAGTGYVRRRELEFTSSGQPREALLADFDATVKMVVSTIAAQSDTDWATGFSGVGTEMPNRFSMILNCAGHADHHLGQILYLQRELIARRG